MKYALILSSFLLSSFFFVSPAFAALDCSDHASDDTSCLCQLDTAELDPGDDDLIEIVTEDEIECQQACDDVEAVSYQFSQCDSGNLDSTGNTSLDNTGYHGTGETPSTQAEVLRDPIVPILNVPIPGLDLEGSVLIDRTTGKVYNNTLGIYVTAAYRFAITAAALIAVVMLMVGGLEYVVSAGSEKRITKAKERMRNAVVGLVLILLSYNLAFLIDPSTVAFGSLSLQYVKTVPVIEREEDPERMAQNPPDLTVTDDPNISTIAGPHLIAYTSENRISTEVLTKLNEAANAYFELTGKNILVTSASRPSSLQAELFTRNCLENGGKCKPSTCDPTGSPFGKSDVISYSKGTGFTKVGELAGVTDHATVVSILTEHANPRYCPHTSNVAIDIFPEGSPGGYQAHVKDISDMIGIMTSPEHGFCRLGSEAWHFELNEKRLSKTSCSMSNSTAVSNGHDPYGCRTYDFKNFCCVEDDATDTTLFKEMCN